MEGIYLVVNLFIVIQTVTSAVMCVYGYKWSKGLIATMSLYVGAGIGVFVSAVLIERIQDPSVLIMAPLSMLIFWILAYKSITLNHFLAGFLLATKVSFMLVMKMYEYSIITDSDLLLALPVMVGLIAGCVTCLKFNKYILIACVAFIGVTEFVPKMFDLINKTLFVATGDISFIFDPLSFILSVFGITIPSNGEVFFMIVLGIVSFCLQYKNAERAGMDYGESIIDDRNLD